jgi:hypothetical protein
LTRGGNGPIEAQRQALILLSDDLRTWRQINGPDRIGGFQRDLAELTKAIFDQAQWPIVDDVPRVDHDHALANLFDVAQVVRGEDHRDVALPILFLDELTDALLHDQVEADGRFVEVDHLWIVDQRGGQLGAHLLTQ